MARFSPHMTVMQRAIEAAAKSLIRDFGEVEQLQVSLKGPGDFVSAADKRSEKILFEELQKARPDFGFLMEEGGEVPAKGRDSGRRWIIDPLDGTDNFLHGVPQWCISLALEEDGEVTHGIVYDPIKDEKFYAEKGNGAFVNSKRLRVSGRSEMPLCMIGCGHPDRFFKNMNPYAKLFHAVHRTGASQRRMGAAALDLAYIAAGRFDGFYEHSLSPWDIAAGSLIIKEAGGTITTFSGKGDPVYEGSVLAGNFDIHGELLKITKEL